RRLEYLPRRVAIRWHTSGRWPSPATHERRRPERRGLGFLSGDELLATVDVVCRARDRRIDHEVNGQRGDVGRANPPADRQRGPKLEAPSVEIVAEQGSRQGGVDEAGRDQIDPDRGELEREAGRQRGHPRRDRRDDLEPRTYPPTGSAADEQQRARRSYLGAAVAGDR